MSLATNITNLATRTSTESKALRTLVNGNQPTLGALTTSAKNNLVAAINELDAAIDALSGGGSAATLDDLTDVVITSAALGNILQHNGTNFVNVATTTYGSAFLSLANQAALMALLATASTTVAGKVELADNTETLTGTAADLAVTPAGLQAKIDALVASAPGLLNTLDELAAALGDNPNFATDVLASIATKQTGHANLTAFSGLTLVTDRLPYANGTGTLALATFTAAGRNLVAGADPAAQRTTLDVYSKAEIGDPETNFVTTFEAGLV